MEIIPILHFFMQINNCSCTVYLMVYNLHPLSNITFPYIYGYFPGLSFLFRSSVHNPANTILFIQYRFIISLDSHGALSFLLLCFYSKLSQSFQSFTFPYEIQNQLYYNAVRILIALKLQVNLERMITFMILNNLHKMPGFFIYLGLLLCSSRYY